MNVMYGKFHTRNVKKYFINFCLLALFWPIYHGQIHCDVEYAQGC
jgi:hypothetical protein